ncbi:MAG: hypothetical protein WBC70_17465 [Candidatus Aminicenantales bacterium]
MDNLLKSFESQPISKKKNQNGGDALVSCSSFDHLPDILDYSSYFFGALQEITPQIATLMKIDDIRVFQNIQMLGNIGLGDIKEVFDVVDALLAVNQLLHDEDADRVGQGLENPGLLFDLSG